MLHHEDVVELELLSETVDPVLTLIISTDPRDPSNSNAAWQLRGRRLLEQTHAPEALVRRAATELEARAAPGRTLVLLVDKEGVRRRLALHLQLPEQAHYGVPLLAPVLSVLSERMRYAVLCLDERAVRMHCVFAGEIEEVTDLLPSLDPAAWATVEAVFHGPGRRVRHGEEKGADWVDSSVADHQHRALRALSTLAGYAVERLRCDLIVICGPGERPAEFEAALPDRLRRLVAGTVGARVEETPAELLPRVEAVEAAAEQDRELKLVSRAVERGVVGADETLAALGQGRVYELIAAAGDRTALPRCSSCGLAVPPGTCPACGGEVAETALDELLPSLAQRHRATLTFVHGEAHQELQRLGGLAGLVRWTG